MKYIVCLIAGIFIAASISYSQSIEELRGVWITNVDSDVLTTDGKIAEAMDYLAGIGINVVFPVVWNKGYTQYPSQVMDDYFGLPIFPQFAGRDPLERIMIEAHRNGMEVIPWFEFGFSTSYSQNGGHILAAYPDWKLKNNQGDLVVKNGFDWMSGIHPEVQEFMLGLITEVIRNYDIDGVQGDDRLPAMPVEGGYEDYTVNLYKSENGGSDPPLNFRNAAWIRWRADKLNEYFQRVRDSVKAGGEYLILSAAPSNYPWGYEEYLQDSKSWVEEEIIDNFIPQLYRTDLNSFIFELNQALNYVPNHRDVFFSGILAKSGLYLISPALLFGSIQANRARNVMGETFFFYEALRANDNLLGDSLKNSFYSIPAIPPYRNGKLWRPKAEAVNEDDEGNVVTGDWQQLSIPGFQPNIYLTNDSNFASIEYYFNVPFEAWFDIYAYIVPNTVNSTAVRHTVFSQSDSTILLIDQKDISNKGWQKLSTDYLVKGDQRLLKIDNIGLESGKYITADAAMIMINRKKSPDVVVTSAENIEISDVIKPAEFSLHQNYPNPFNPETTIEFAIPSAGRVKLNVYDILGKEVAVLVDGELTAGSYTEEFDGNGLSSGVYFYRMTYKGGTESRKMVILR